MKNIISEMSDTIASVWFNRVLTMGNISLDLLSKMNMVNVNYFVYRHNGRLTKTGHEKIKSLRY